MSQAIEARVHNGFNFLTGYFGNREWVNKINLDKLNMTVGNKCILGQLFTQIHPKNSYEVGLDELHIDNKAGTRLGFNLAVNSEALELTNCWIDKIRSTREELVKEQSVPTLREALENLMGFLDTPIGRHTYKNNSFMVEAVEIAKRAMKA